ncbi:hypothetical protein [Streptomyces sp. NPDC006333]|uniref:hypothetical protein n=1 Tax=Streptomyces sp. NPDC006333 TaxID=3156753 RepID=UPI0033B7386E
MLFVSSEDARVRGHPRGCSNARKYIPGLALLQLRIIGPVLRVELWDSNPVAPTAKAPDPTRVGQHGLEIVAAFARTVTVEQTAVGKRITADVLLAPDTAYGTGRAAAAPRRGTSRIHGSARTAFGRPFFALTW